MLKIGLSSCGGKELNEETFRNYSEAGIDAIEISRTIEGCKTIDYKEVKRLSEKYGVQLWSFHLPFVPFDVINPASSDKKVREYTVEYFMELIGKASDIGFEKFVIHPSGEPISDCDREEAMKCSIDTLSILADKAEKCGATIAVENLPRTCLGKNSDEILRLISGNDKLKVCFDTNHLLAEDGLEFLDKVGNKIVTVHVSDYDFIDERHWLPGEGKTDWVKFIDKFEEIGYNGVWLYELGFRSPKTLTRSRDLTCKDFYENAMAIFNREKLNVIK